MELKDFWQTALGEIELQVSRPNFVTWFRNSDLIEKKDGTATVALPNSFAKEWVENKYEKIVLAAVRSLDVSTKKIQFIVGSNAKAATNKKLDTETKEESGQAPIFDLKIDPETNLNPRYTLNSFAVGKSNELAYAAAVAVIQEIGRKYNPLFFYGGVGVGKTHLLQALGNEIKNLYQNKIRVKYVSSEKFTNDVVWAVRNKRTDTMKEKYRGVDVFIIDDIQFIGGKTATEEEFFHTFNELFENNKQIIISSDRPPKHIPTLEDRLRSRFEGGMIADISSPDYELRLAVLQNKLKERGIELSKETVDFIASKVQKNLRELEGVLNRILFYRQTKGVELTPKVVEQIINETVKEPTKNINPNHIIKVVADVYEISANDMAGRCRKKEIVEPRQIAMYLLRDVLNMSFPYIGEKLGKRDHTTAIYAFEKISEDINKNPSLNQRVLMIKDLLNQS